MPIPLPVIADVKRVAFRWLEDDTGQQAVNVMHFRTADTVAGLIATLTAQVESAMWACAVPGAFIYELDVIPLDGVSAVTIHPTGGAPSTAPWAGSTAGDFVPSTGGIIKVRTATRGRDNRGRTFLPFTSEGAMVDGRLVAGTRTTMQGSWDDWLADLLAAAIPVEPGVAAYDRANAGAGAHFTTANAFVVEQFLATQKKRQNRLRV